MPTNTTGTPTKKVLDFTNVKDASGVNPKHLDPGDYRMKITKVSEEPNKKDASVTNWIFLFVPNHMQSASYPYYCVLQENQLWKVRNLLIAAGVQVPKKKVGVDPNKLVGREVGVTLDDDEYEGKMKSVITAVFPASDLDDEDTPADDGDTDPEDEIDPDEDEAEEEPEPEPVKAAPKKKAKAKPAPAPVEDEDEVEDEDLEEIDIEDL